MLQHSYRLLLRRCTHLIIAGKLCSIDNGISRYIWPKSSPKVADALLPANKLDWSCQGLPNAGASGTLELINTAKKQSPCDDGIC